MLALSVQKGDYIVLETENGLVKIQVIDINSSGNCKLALDAPQDVKIVRGVLWEEQHPESNLKLYIPNTRK